MLALLDLADGVVEVNSVLEANMIIHFCKEQSAKVRGLFRSGFNPMSGVRPNTKIFMHLRRQQLANRTEPSVLASRTEKLSPWCSLRTAQSRSQRLFAGNCNHALHS